MSKLVLSAILVTTAAWGQQLSISPVPSGVKLQWERVFPASSGVPTRIHTRIFSSADLRDWVLEETVSNLESQGNGTSSHTAPRNGSARFYRAETSYSYAHRAGPSAQPARYNRQYLNSTAVAGKLPPLESDTSGADPNCLDGIPWNPTSATFFANFNTSPAEHNAGLPPGDPDRRLTDFRLNAAELAAFTKNGFVVSPRIASYSGFGGYQSYAPVDFYYSVWSDDLPVFITADSVLDAWHQTFNSMLEEVEELVLYPSLRALLDQRLAPELQGLKTEWQDNAAPGADHVRQALVDLGVYLETAFRIARGSDPGPATTDRSEPSHWQQAVIAAQDPLKIGLYGDIWRFEDMSLYTPRGHYTRSSLLKGYFQSVVWLAQAQFHIAGEQPAAQWDRELRAAILLSLLVRDSGGIEDWQRLENFMQGLSGQPDSMTVVEMLALLSSLSLDDVSAITSDENLATVREALLGSSYGIQEINGGKHEVDPDAPLRELPRALSLFGQRWTPDAWTFQKTVLPEVIENDQIVPRRIPSGLDVAFSTLGNDAAYPIVLDRMMDPDGVPFRDGFDYRRNLLSARATLDSQDQEFWTEHVYGSWLHCLRALSPSLPETAPDTFRTKSWKRRTMNTQLVSWTQLRHDTLLYAKQSFTPPQLCEFPEGYVDPYPELWQRLSDMALKYKSLLSVYTLSGTIGVEKRSLELTGFVPPPLSLWTYQGYLTEGPPGTTVHPSLIMQIDRAGRIAHISAHLENFSARCLELKEIATRQLAGQPLTEEMNNFIAATVEDFSIVGYGSERLYNGWFPELYFDYAFAEPGDHPSSEWNPSVVDVHTDSVDLIWSDPGAVLHEGTGRAQFMLVAVKHPDGSSCAYGGPVMSHHEFLEPLGTRLSDEQWKNEMQNHVEPANDDWKQEFLIAE